MNRKDMRRMEKKPFTPREIVEKLDQYIIGQLDAKKSSGGGFKKPLQKKFFT
ncbi:hypothetical protein BsIDN1_29490 [Bacillus safensis]|uniref:Uncharacterized protein n=1 Tax=Bacillus safensis TaxID=561879 RepID=A0A5S9M8V3_BACIA|nr:hypothetical protein BsIDN1_29490 [Bacillus safensis]